MATVRCCTIVLLLYQVSHYRYASKLCTLRSLSVVPRARCIFGTYVKRQQSSCYDANSSLDHEAMECQNWFAFVLLPRAMSRQLSCLLAYWYVFACLPACLLTCLRACLRACLPACLPACLLAWVLVFLRVYPLACLLACVLACLFACWSACALA